MDNEQKIKEYFSKLPLTVQQSIKTNDWAKRVGEIGQKYSLHLDQISSLEYEVLFVMIGMEPEEDFIANITKEVGVSSIVAEQLANEANERIFKTILKTIEEKTAPEAERFAKVEEPQITENKIEENPLVSEIESLANDLPSEPPAATPEPHHEHKTVEPPADLPGIIEEETPVQQVVVAQTMLTPTPIPTPPSLADTKLNSIVESKTETKIVANTASTPETPPIKSYTTDPYREPIE